MGGQPQHASALDLGIMGALSWGSQSRAARQELHEAHMRHAFDAGAAHGSRTADGRSAALHT